jgi:signal transduction histidine kinase/ActR/RegA family two-component response regulator
MEQFLPTIAGLLGWLLSLILLFKISRREAYTAERYQGQTKRVYEMARGIAAQVGLTQTEAQISVYKLLSRIYQNFHLVALEFSLYDEGSESSSGAILLGSPKSSQTQQMLSKDNLTDVPSGQVFHRLIQFAGTTFGMLRVEFDDGSSLSEDEKLFFDLALLELSITLVNAKFTEELLRMRKLSEESVQAKTGFLANLSHELRGPLGIIMNSSELALDGLCGELSEASKESFGMIKSSGEHLLDLVNDVLDYAKVESGKIQISPVPLAVKDLLDDLCHVVRSQAHTKNHVLLQEEVDLSLGILVDKRHVRQMLINLLTNAIKYTPEGGTITVKAERYLSDKVKLIVRDTGIGIPEAQRSKVFGAFERIEHSYAQSQVGTGLGMPLTKRLAEANSGGVDFVSEEGKGSTFWIFLPYVMIDQKEEQAEQQANSNGEPNQLKLLGRGETLLLVDKDLETRGMLARYLEHSGYNVIGAATGRDVIKNIRESSLQLAVIESDLGEIQGEDVITVLRANPKTAKIPVVLLSSRAFVFDIERFLRLGVDRCLSKPIELSELSSTVRKLLDETSVADPTVNHPAH